MIDRVHQRNAGACDGSGAGAAVRLDYVTIDIDGVLTKPGQVNRRPQGATNQPLDLHGSATLLTLARLPGHAGTRGTRQHAVFRRDPATSLAAHKARHSLLY